MHNHISPLIIVCLFYSWIYVFFLPLQQLVEGVRAGRPHLKMDKRMTGSCSIDEVLSEVRDTVEEKKTYGIGLIFSIVCGANIWRFLSLASLQCLSVYHVSYCLQVLNYTYRDHIHSWYKRISDDEEKFRYDIRQTMQRVIIAFSERWVIVCELSVRDHVGDIM